MNILFWFGGLTKKTVVPVGANLNSIMNAWYGKKRYVYVLNVI